MCNVNSDGCKMSFCTTNYRNCCWINNWSRPTRGSRLSHKWVIKQIHTYCYWCALLLNHLHVHLLNITKTNCIVSLHVRVSLRGDSCLLMMNSLLETNHTDFSFLCTHIHMSAFCVHILSFAIVLFMHNRIHKNATLLSELNLPSFGCEFMEGCVGMLSVGLTPSENFR